MKYNRKSFCDETFIFNINSLQNLVLFVFLLNQESSFFIIMLKSKQNIFNKNTTKTNCS